MKDTISKLTPMLETRNMQETIAFYTGMLGFSVGNYSEEWGWVYLSSGETAIMFTRPNEHRNIPYLIMSGSLYFTVDEIDNYWSALKGSCAICYPIENFDYGMREFAIYDNNGYILQFGEAAIANS